MQHLNFSYKDAYFLPVWKRTWFIGKLKDNIEKQQQHQNTNTSRQNSSNNIFKKQF